MKTSWKHDGSNLLQILGRRVLCAALLLQEAFVRLSRITGTKGINVSWVLATLQT